jgi:hypothetical protein
MFFKKKAMKIQFTIPLRIKGLRGDIIGLSIEQMKHREAQVKFHKTIQCIGDANEDSENVHLMNHDMITNKRIILIPGVREMLFISLLVFLATLLVFCAYFFFLFMTAIQYTTKEQELFDFLYPAGFNTNTIHRTAILAGGQYVHVMIIFTLCYMLLPVSNLIGCFLLSFLSFII